MSAPLLAPSWPVLKHASNEANLATGYLWLKDDEMADSNNLPVPGVIALEIVEDLQAALEQFRLIASDLAESAI